MIIIRFIRYFVEVLSSRYYDYINILIMASLLSIINL